MLPPAEDAKELSKVHKQLLGRYYQLLFYRNEDADRAQIIYLKQKAS